MLCSCFTPGKQASEIPTHSKNITEVQPSEDKDTLYPKETLVPNEESEEESPEEVIPPAPIISPKAVADKSPLKKAEKADEESLLELHTPLLAEEKGDSLSLESTLPANPPKLIAEIQQDDSQPKELEIEPPLPESTIPVVAETENNLENTNNSKGVFP